MTKIDKIKKILSQFDEVEFAYLFGSYADGTFRDNSDIDIAVYIKDGYSIFDTKLKVHHKLEISLNSEIDVLALNQIKNFYLLKAILDYDVVLKDSKDDSRVMFELKKHHEILDYEEFKRMIDVA